MKVFVLTDSSISTCCNSVYKNKQDVFKMIKEEYKLPRNKITELDNIGQVENGNSILYLNQVDVM